MVIKLLKRALRRTAIAIVRSARRDEIQINPASGLDGSAYLRVAMRPAR
jgi:hypothetical protein